MPLLSLKDRTVFSCIDVISLLLLLAISQSLLTFAITLASTVGIRERTHSGLEIWVQSAWLLAIVSPSLGALLS